MAPRTQKRVCPLFLFLFMVLCPCAGNAQDVLAMLVSRSPEERSMGVEVLRSCGQQARPGLTEALANGDTEHRRGAVMGLALLPQPELSLDALLAALDDQDPTVRSLAAHTLSRVEQAAAPLAGMLGAGDDRARVAAALSLAKMGEPAVPALIHTLESPDVAVRAKAAWLLGAMGPGAMAAVPALVRALDTSDMRLIHVLAESIDLIGPDPSMLYLELTMLDAGDHPFSRLGAAGAPTLVKLLTRPGTPLGQVCLYTLARMGTQAEPALKSVLATGTDGQKTAAALLLTGIDPELAHSLNPELREALKGHAQADH